ncbi:unnamed protein product [Protopolystoma xenopodis]|uniref:Uncharacterized protein n=1 Tax=Protopolystoma xenopodis TaxID=117903 RepID=A0A448X2D1_9PLAT|nr:unnamed protein product [Protopolystoma xenopodis]
MKSFSGDVCRGGTDERLAQFHRGRGMESRGLVRTIQQSSLRSNRALGSGENHFTDSFQPTFPSKWRVMRQANPYNHISAIESRKLIRLSPRPESMHSDEAYSDLCRASCTLIYDFVCVFLV